MKMVTRLLKLLVVFACAAYSTAASAQVLTWTNVIAQTLPGGNFGRGTNWSGDNLSGTATTNTPISGTICTFDGTVSGPLFVLDVDGINGAGGGNPIGGSFGANGITIHMTPTQTSPLTFYSTNVAPGMGFNGFNVDAGAGQLILGNDTTAQMIATLRPSSGIHAWENDSSFPTIINPNFQIQNGGGTAHEINFKGTGDFGITNNLRNNNNAPVNTIVWDSTGTTTWTKGGANDLFNDGGLGNVVINAGTVIVKSSGLLAITGGNTLTHNGVLLVLDSGASGSDTFARSILGTGPIQINSGSWTMTSGGSTFSGNWALNGGELSANGTESAGSSGPLGEGGTISFNGGTLGYGPNNTFDYSPRFSTVDGQAYSFDTAGQNVTFATGLIGNNAVTKIGPGTLTLAGANTYSGLTTVSAGKLVFQGPKTGTANIVVVDGGALGVTQTNAQTTPNTLSITNSTLEFNGVTSEATPLLTAGTLNASGTITVNVNSGTFTAGHSYPLFRWTTGTAPAVTLGFLGGALGTLSTNGGKTIQLDVSALADNWAGTAGNNWKAANNWLAGGVPITYADPTPVVFDDSALGSTAVTVDGLVQPKSVVVNNTTLIYSISSNPGQDIGGAANLTKNGTGSLSLSGGANAYTGISTFNGGIVSITALANGGQPSDIGAAGSGVTNIVFNGGTLQYQGNAVDIDRGFSVGTGGGAIDASGAGALSLNKTGAIGLSGAGARAFTLTGTSTDTNTLAGTLGDQGGASSLTKNGPGTWILTGNNNYSGLTTIGNGTLQLGVGGATGALGSGNVVNNGSLHANRTNSVTINSVISGGGSVVNDGSGTLVLANNNTYTGGTTINAGTIQVGNGGGTGSLSPGNGITDNGQLTFNTTGAFSYTAPISGTGNVFVTSSATIKAIGNNTYTGWTLINTNATFQPSEGNQGAFVSSVVTNYGTFRLVRQDQGTFGYSNNIVGSGRLVKDVNNNNDNDVTLAGINTYTGGTIIGGGGIVLGDGITTNAGSIVGNVLFTNSLLTSQDDRRYIEFNHPEDLTFPGLISGTTSGALGNSGQLIQMGTGVLTVTANNTYTGGTVVSNGAVQVGTGGTTGLIGTGNATVGTPTGRLIFNRSDNLTFTGTITGDGSLIQMGAGALTLTASNTITGATVVSNGTLVVASAVNGDMDVSGGTFAAGAPGTVTTVTIGGNLNITNGAILVSLNKSLAQSNTLVNVMASYNYVGGSLKIENFGPTLTVGDKFVIFNQPIANGHTIPIVSPGFTVANNLETDGSVTVTSVGQIPQPTLTGLSVVGNSVVITGTNNAGNNGATYVLYSSTNLTTPLSSWSVISSGSFNATGNISVTNPVSGAQRFYLLRTP